MHSGQRIHTSLAVVAFYLLISLSGPYSAQATTVGVITAGGLPVVDLASTGLFSAGEVTVLYPLGATPTLLDGENQPLYDAVLVYSNAAFDDGEGLGDALADYVDAGGGVVLATFCFSNLAQYRIGGRLLEEVGYSPLLPTEEAGSSPGTFQWPPPMVCHPLFEGLEEAPTYLYYSNFGRPELSCPQDGCDSESPEAVVLASTEGGDNLVASNAAGTVMAINIHASANTIYNDAGGRLFANALLLVGSGGVTDCNANGLPDNCDIADGTSLDCQDNGTPDECEIAAGTSTDCDGNGLPDECELVAGSAADCNGNEVPDACEIDQDTPGGPYYCTADCDPDCNENGVPDFCEPEEPGACDCNGNGIDDATDIAAGSSEDCNGNGRPDECEITMTDLEEADYAAEPSLPIPDASTVEHTITVPGSDPVRDVDVELDISHNWDRDLTISLRHEQVSVLLIDTRGGGGYDFTGTILDDEAKLTIAEGSAPFTGSYRPEETLTALDGMDQSGDWTLIVTDAMAPDDGLLNAWALHLDVETNASLDCNDNGVLDECDLAEGTSSDLNGNQVPDDCEADCNFNGVPDELDLAGGTSADCNANGVPDECDRRNDPSLDCNDNLILDQCDIAVGTSLDTNGDGIPDECQQPCLCGDLSGDGQVDLQDLATFAMCFGAGPGHLPSGCAPQEYTCSDLNGDDWVNLSDFATLAAIYSLPPDNQNCNW